MYQDSWYSILLKAILTIGALCYNLANSRILESPPSLEKMSFVPLAKEGVLPIEQRNFNPYVCCLLSVVTGRDDTVLVPIHGLLSRCPGRTFDRNV
jgi:hypothetical protein